MSGQLAGNVVVVTGGAGRLGRAFCTAISREGGTAVIADNDASAANQLAAKLVRDHGVQAAWPVNLDITDAPSIDRAIGELHARYGRIDAVVNNAYPRNARYGAPVDQVTYADFADNVSRHTGGYFITAQRFASYFSKQGHGNIVFMGSIYGVVAPRFGIYSGTPMTMPVEYAVIKAGVIHLARYFAQYYKPQGIRVNALSPGGVAADQPANFVRQYSAHAAGSRMLTEVDVCGSLIFLLSPESSHFTGQNLVVDDGWSL